MLRTELLEKSPNFAIWGSMPAHNHLPHLAVLFLASSFQHMAFYSYFTTVFHLILWVFWLLPQSCNWRRMVFCFLKCSLSQMKLGTTAWQECFFSYCFFNSSWICQNKKSTHGLEQATAGFNAFPKKKLFCMNIWKAIESISYSISLHSYNPGFLNSLWC